VAAPASRSFAGPTAGTVVVDDTCVAYPKQLACLWRRMSWAIPCAGGACVFGPGKTTTRECLRGLPSGTNLAGAGQPRATRTMMWSARHLPATLGAEHPAVPSVLNGQCAGSVTIRAALPLPPDNPLWW